MIGLAGCGSLVVGSQEIFSWKTLPIGSGDDLIYAFDPAQDQSGRMFAAALQAVQQIQPHEPLLVLPEGVLLNYMLRTRGPIPGFQFLPSALANGQAANYVRQLEQNPPPLVVILPRNLREHGVMRYGASPEHGEDLIEWLRTEYQVTQAKGDPLDPDNPG